MHKYINPEFHTKIMTELCALEEDHNIRILFATLCNDFIELLKYVFTHGAILGVIAPDTNGTLV